MWLDEGSDLARVTGERIEQRKRAVGGEHHILITLSSQGDAVPAAVLEAVRASPPTWRFWFRLHPVDQAARRAEAQRLLGPLGVDLGLLDFATEVPLHALLARMDGHLTVSLSTVVTEAAAHGIPSIACGKEAPDFFRDEMEAGMLVVAETATEILAALRHFLPQGRRPVRPRPPRAPDTIRRLLSGDFAPHSPAPPLRPA